jgi:hypothetical protein
LLIEPRGHNSHDVADCGTLLVVLQRDALPGDDLASRFDKYVRMDYCGGQELPVEVRDIVLEGSRLPGDNGKPQGAKPDWFDADLFLAGQRCAREYSFGLAQSELLSLFLMFSVPAGVDPLIATGRCVHPTRVRIPVKVLIFFSVSNCVYHRRKSK